VVSGALRPRPPIWAVARPGIRPGSMAQPNAGRWWWARSSEAPFYETPLVAGFGCSRKKRSISQLASEPRGSVCDPSGLPPDHA